MRFVLGLLQIYIEAEGGEQTEAVLVHLKEMSSIEIIGQTLVGYLAN